MQERDHLARGKAQQTAARHVAEWTKRADHNIYAMMRSMTLFTDLFSAEPLQDQGAAPEPGDAKALKKAYHKLAAKLHPDRQLQNPTHIQVLAEEVFKQLSIYYQKEHDRLLSV